MADIPWMVREELLEDMMFESRDLNDEEEAWQEWGKRVSSRTSKCKGLEMERAGPERPVKASVRIPRAQHPGQTSLGWGSWQFFPHSPGRPRGAGQLSQVAWERARGRPVSDPNFFLLPLYLGKAASAQPQPCTIPIPDFHFLRRQGSCEAQEENTHFGLCVTAEFRTLPEF